MIDKLSKEMFEKIYNETYAHIFSEDRYDEYIEYKRTGPEIEEHFFEPEIGKEYVIISKNNPKSYQICCGGYGIFSVSNNNENEIYTNVISNKILNIKK